MRLPSIIPLVIVGALAASAAHTSARGAQTQDPVEDRLHRIDEFVWHGRLFLKGRRTLQQVRRLSALLNETIEKTPNRYFPDQIDEYRMLTFEGLELYGRVKSTQEFRTITTVITSAKWKVRDGLNVGTNAARIERVLGPPMERTDTVLHYQGESERVNFYVEKGVIKKLEFWDYVD